MYTCRCQKTVAWYDTYDESCPLPYGWAIVTDPATKRLYYWNRHTNAVSWDQPTAPFVAAPVKA